MMRHHFRLVAATLLIVVGCHRSSTPRAAVFALASAPAVDTIAGTVSLPLHQGWVRDRLVWYIITESSDRDDARRRGVTWSPRMASLGTSHAVQPVAELDGQLHYMAGVDFSPKFSLVAAPDSGFPALEAKPGSVGEEGYSPFVRLTNGVVLNAPIIADEYEAIERVARLDIGRGRAIMRLARGYAAGRHAWYISTDASDAAVAAFERSTWAPKLAQAPSVATYEAGTARFYLLAVVNGERGRGNPDRQGLQSALVDGLSPLNVLEGSPDPEHPDERYTPLWDLHLVRWTGEAIAAGRRFKIASLDEARAYAERGFLVSAAPGTPNHNLGGLNAQDIVINCQIMATFAR